MTRGSTFWLPRSSWTNSGAPYLRAARYGDELPVRFRCGPVLRLAGFAFVIFLLVGPSLADGAEIRGIRFGVTDERTRIVFDLNDNSFEYRVLPDGDTSVTLLLPDVRMAENVKAPTTRRGLLQTAMISEEGAEGSRIVLRFTRSCRVKHFTLDANQQYPPRLVVDVFPAAPGESQPEPTPPPPPKPETKPETKPEEPTPTPPVQPEPEPARTPEPPPKPATGDDDTQSGDAEVKPAPIPTPSEPLEPAPRRSGGPRVVVIDAGHGGDDPGATGTGLREKDVCLDVARRLHKLLTGSTGIAPLLTRSRDVRIPLRDRMQIADDAQADLFVSIHVNAAPVKSASGVEVFFLSLGAASDEAARELAKLENEAFVMDEASVGDEELPFSLSLRQSDTLLRSSRAAEVVLDHFVERNLARSRGVKQAGFAVLKSYQTPSVLVELGFVSSREDREALKSADHRQEARRGHGRRNPRVSERVRALTLTQ